MHIEGNIEVPTRTKIHAQPGKPLTPSIFWIAAARRPEKAPASDVTLNIIAKRS